MESHSTKQISIYVVTEKNLFIYKTKEETTIEDIIIHVCQELQISPVTRHLFGLLCEDNNWLALNFKIYHSKIDKLFLRFRFKVPCIDKLRNLDTVAFNYYYFQVRDDVLSNRVSDISCDKHKDKLVGLGVTDMYRDILENRISQSNVLNNYKKYIPKEILRNHFFFLKKPMDQSLSLVIKKGVTDILYIKSGYLEEFEGIAPNYLNEEYTAWIMESDATRYINIKVNPYHEEMPGIQFKSGDSMEWQQVCSVEDMCFVSLRRDGSIELSRKTGIPLYIMFKSPNETVSFVSLLDGYYRLSVKWTFNLCKDLFTPSLLKLKKLKCHGPVGGEFAYAKLEEKRNNQFGCYILRESESTYHNYYVDVCTMDSHKPVTYAIISKKDGTFWFGADKECYKSIQGIIDTYHSANKSLFFLECVPSSEYEESNLLLCQPTISKSKAFSTIQPGDKLYGPTQCIHLKNLQIFFGKCTEEDQGYTQIHKCFWKRNKKEKIEVALKSLKPFHHKDKLKDFLKLASNWSLLRSSSFVNLLGVTLADPIAMIMEYFPLGPLNNYLQAKKLIVKDVDLVEAATYLANALWLMEEEGLVHGRVRCEKIMVAAHTENSFVVRLADPGLFSCYNELDFHWIPPELYSSPDTAWKNSSADMWAFGTTLWEMFSFGEIPPTIFELPNGEETVLRNFYLKGNRLPCPKNCPRYVYNLMMECWHFDPALRKKPQAAQRDINQLLYQVFNSRLRHSYATIVPAHKSKSTSSDTLNDVYSEALDDTSLKSISTQLSSLYSFEEAPIAWYPPAEPLSMSIISEGQAFNECVYSTEVSAMLSNLDFSTDTTSLGGISSLQSIFELNADVNVVLQGKIGQGFYGEVYKGIIEDRNCPNEPQSVAVKRLRIVDNNTWMSDFEREIEIMKKLKHPNIVEMKGVILEPEVNLFMEYVEHGSLKCYLSINRDRLSQKHILKYALDVAKGMDYLGKMKIVHRDLAARNVLVADEFNVKISDFGLAQFVGQSNYYISQSNRELPIKWFAPESLRYGKFSTQTDVWSYGVTLYEMFSFGEEPIIESFQESARLLDALDKGIRLPRPKACPNEVFVNLIAPCWMYEAKDRPQFNSIISIVEDLLQSGDKS